MLYSTEKLIDEMQQIRRSMASVFENIAKSAENGLSNSQTLEAILNMTAMQSAQQNKMVEALIILFERS